MNNAMTIPKTIDIAGHRLSRREFLKHTSAAAIGLTVPAVYGAEPSANAPPPLSAVDRFNYVVGTQTIGASYQFTKQPRLIETAQAIREMGSSVIKFTMNHTERGTFQSLHDIAANNPIIKQIFEMPFAHYMLWAYPINRKKAEQDDSGRNTELYDLCCYLLRAFRGTG